MKVERGYKAVENIKHNKWRVYYEQKNYAKVVYIDYPIAEFDTEKEAEEYINTISYKGEYIIIPPFKKFDIRKRVLNKSQIKPKEYIVFMILHSWRHDKRTTKFEKIKCVDIKEAREKAEPIRAKYINKQNVSSISLSVFRLRGNKRVNIDDYYSIKKLLDNYKIELPKGLKNSMPTNEDLIAYSI